MTTQKSKPTSRRSTSKAKAKTTGLVDKGVAFLNKTLSSQRARAQRGVKQARAFGADILENISKRLDEASRRVDELAKKTR